MLKYCALISLCAWSAFAADFVTGMGARLVIGQKTFTQQDPGASDTLLGGVGGLAVAGDTLFVADSNRASFTPINHRVLLYKNLSQQLPHPQAPILPFTGRCPACVGRADTVLGQANFTSTDPHVSQTGLRLPTGIASDGQRLAVADTGNNRVLLWNSVPQSMDQPADIVLGQADFNSLRAVVVDNKSFRAPQGVWIQEGRLYVADTQNHRVMIWNSLPTRNDAPADLVLGQPNFNTVVQPDLTQETLNAQANTLLNPVSVTSDGIRLFVTDLGHNRVLIWNSIPTQNRQPANVVVGQPDFTTPYANYSFTGTAAINADDKTNKQTPVMCTDSTGTDPAGNPTYPVRCGKTLDFPRYALSDGSRLFIADGGNDRVLIFNTIPTVNGAKADVILGQPDEFADEVSSTTDLFHPLLRQSAADIIATPTALAWDGTNLYVTDPSNRRVLVFTPGEFLVQINGVRNAASREIYAIGAVAITGTITAEDEITVTINDVNHKYKVVNDDTVATVITNLTKVINADADPAVFAEEEQQLSLVKLVARKGGVQGNDITLAVTVSDKATIIATPSGSNLANGQNAAIIAPGTLITFLAREGKTLADQTAAADPTQNLPLVMGGVEVYFDGIRSPLLYVSPTEVRAQVPFEVQDANSISAYIRIQRNNGTVDASAAVAVPISQQNPGLFAMDGTDPRPAMAFHSSSYASGSILVDGIITPGDTVRVLIEDRVYSYTVQTGDTLDSVRDAFVALINGNPEEKVVASVVPSFSRVRLRAKVPGPAGNGIPVATSASDGATLVITITNPELCCANVAGAPVTEQNPARPGEAIIFYATGLGIVGPQEALSAIKTGDVYQGPAFNDPALHDPQGFVSAQINNTTANVLSAGLKPGTVGIYEVLLELGGGTQPNPLAQVHISQDIYTSNVVTMAVSDPATPQP